MFAAAGHGSVEGVDEEASGFAQMALLIALVQAENVDDADLDEFLQEARRIADAAISQS
jgi:hypothetical protein